MRLNKKQLEQVAADETHICSRLSNYSLDKRIQEIKYEMQIIVARYDAALGVLIERDTGLSVDEFKKRYAPD